MSVYCNALLAYAAKATTDKLRRVGTGTKKFERGLSRLLHTELHWLDVPERVMYKLNVRLAWSSAAVLVRLLPTSLWCSVTASSPICWSTTAECWTYRTRSGVHLPGGLSMWLARWCGIRCRTTWETRQSVETLSASTVRDVLIVVAH